MTSSVHAAPRPEPVREQRLRVGRPQPREAALAEGERAVVLDDARRHEPGARVLLEHVDERRQSVGADRGVRVEQQHVGRVAARRAEVAAGREAVVPRLRGRGRRPAPRAPRRCRRATRCRRPSRARRRRAAASRRRGSSARCCTRRSPRAPALRPTGRVVARRRPRGSPDRARLGCSASPSKGRAAAELRAYPPV